MCIKHLTSYPLVLDCIALTVVPLKKDSPSCISESLLAINFVTKLPSGFTELTLHKSNKITTGKMFITIGLCMLKSGV